MVLTVRETRVFMPGVKWRVAHVTFAGSTLSAGQRRRKTVPVGGLVSRVETDFGTGVPASVQTVSASGNCSVRCAASGVHQPLDPCGPACEASPGGTAGPVQRCGRGDPALEPEECMLSESVPGTPPEVFAPVEVPSPSQPPEEVEYVQLLTPEGERVDNPD